MCCLWVPFVFIKIVLAQSGTAFNYAVIMCIWSVYWLRYADEFMSVLTENIRGIIAIRETWNDRYKRRRSGFINTDVYLGYSSTVEAG